MSLYKCGGTSDDFTADGVLRYMYWKNVQGEGNSGYGSTDRTSSPRYFGTGIITPVSYNVWWGGSGSGNNTFVFSSSASKIRVRIMILSDGANDVIGSRGISFSGCTAKILSSTDSSTPCVIYTDAILSSISGNVTITASGCIALGGMAMTAGIL